LIIGGPACAAHHCRSDNVNVVEAVEPVPSTKAGADSTARTAETAGWKVGDAGSKSTNNEGRRDVTLLESDVRGRGRRESVRRYDGERGVLAR
jgi:hypothetical protein